MYAWMYAHICWDSRSRQQWMNCTFNISLHFVTLCHLRGNNLMRSAVVPCHVLIILFLAGTLHSGGFQTFQSEQILLIIDLWLTFYFTVYFRCFWFLIGIDLWWIPDILCHALFSGCWIFTDSDLLTRINMIKNGGFYRTERLLSHNVNYHWSDSFLSSGYTVQQICFCRWFHIGRLRSWPISCRISWGFCCFECRIWSQFKHFRWLRGWKTTTFKWWICTGKNRLHYLKVRECQVLYAKCFK